MLALLVLLILFPDADATAQGQQPQGAEDWAWDRIRTGRIADFHARCGQLDPLQLMAGPVPVVNFDGSALVAHFAAARMHSNSFLYMRKMTIGGSVDLQGAKVDGNIEMDGVSVAGTMDAGAAAPAMLGGWDHGFNQHPFRISQIRWVAQPVAVVTRAVSVVHIGTSGKTGAVERITRDSSRSSPTR
jgi:hypothetical protein